MTDEYESQGVVIIEVNASMTSQPALAAWAESYDYYSLRIVPANQIVNDYNKTQILDIRGYVLINLTTMKVINGNCGNTFEGGEACIDDYLSV
jgi:hypothetical protein